MYKVVKQNRHWDAIDCKDGIYLPTLAWTMDPTTWAHCIGDIGLLI